jgi:hypothetical protein
MMPIEESDDYGKQAIYAIFIVGFGWVAGLRTRRQRERTFRRCAACPDWRRCQLNQVGQFLTDQRRWATCCVSRATIIRLHDGLPLHRASWTEDLIFEYLADRQHVPILMCARAVTFVLGMNRNGAMLPVGNVPVSRTKQVMTPESAFENGSVQTFLFCRRAEDGEDVAELTPGSSPLCCFTGADSGMRVGLESMWSKRCSRLNLLASKLVRYADFLIAANGVSPFLKCNASKSRIGSRYGKYVSRCPNLIRGQTSRRRGPVFTISNQGDRSKSRSANGE